MTVQRKKHGIVPSHRSAPTVRNEARDDSPILPLMLKSSLLGALAAAVCGLIMLTALSAIAISSPDPTSLLLPLGLGALLPSNFVGGFVTVKKVGEYPLVCGMVCGATFTLFSLFFALILRGLPSSGYSFAVSALLHGAAVLFSVLGAFAGNVKKKRKIMSKRYR